MGIPYSLVGTIVVILLVILGKRYNMLYSIFCNILAALLIIHVIFIKRMLIKRMRYKNKRNPGNNHKKKSFRIVGLTAEVFDSIIKAIRPVKKDVDYYVTLYKFVVTGHLIAADELKTIRDLIQEVSRVSLIWAYIPYDFDMSKNDAQIVQDILSNIDSFFDTTAPWENNMSTTVDCIAKDKQRLEQLFVKKGWDVDKYKTTDLYEILKNKNTKNKTLFGYITQDMLNDQLIDKYSYIYLNRDLGIVIKTYSDIAVT